MNRPPASSRSVFVGNIPYEMSEEQLTEVFKEAGPVVSFRLMFDRDTGKPRGYGFCEFLDAETAASAVRNLNNYDIGGRQLRVDFADNSNSAGPDRPGPGPPRPDDRGDHRELRRDRRSPPSRERDLLPPRAQLPAGGGPPPNPQAAQQAIVNTLQSMNANQLFDLMSQMKMFATQNPEQARILLIQNPQMSYAILQGLLMMNLVDPNTAQRIAQSSPGVQLPPGYHYSAAQPGAPPPQPPLPTQPPPRHIPQQAPPPPQPGIGGYAEMGPPAHYAASPAPAPARGPAYAPAPLMPPAPAMQSSHMHAGPPPPIAQPPVSPHQAAPPGMPLQHSTLPQSAMSLEEQQKQLLLQVLNLTPEQINSLPPDQRASVQALKQQLLMGQGA